MDVTLLRVQETTMPGERGALVKAVRVEFMIGDHGPFTEMFPREGLSGPAIRQKTEALARELEAAGFR